MFLTGGAKTRAAALLKKVEAMDENGINFDFEINISNFKSKTLLQKPIKEILTKLSASITSMRSYEKNVIASIDISYTEDDDKYAGIRENISNKFDELSDKASLLQIELLDKASFFQIATATPDNFGTATLETLGINSKSAIIDFLKGVSSENNTLFKALKEMKNISNDMIQYIDWFEKNCNTEGADKTQIMCKTCRDFANIIFKLSKCTWSYCNDVLYIIAQTLNTNNKQ